MKTTFTNLFCLMGCWLLLLGPTGAQGQAPDRLVSGILRDETGLPLPGVNIRVKGNSTGTVTDAEGRYSLRVALGSTLVFSYVGFTTYEVVVTERNSDRLGGGPDNSPPPPKPVPNPQPQSPGSSPQGVAVLGDDSPGRVFQPADNRSNTYYMSGMPSGGSTASGNIYKIVFLPPKKAMRKFGDQGRNGVYYFKTQNPAPRQSNLAQPWRVSYVTSFSVDQVNRLPALQNQFAQGRPLGGQATWQGAETGEIFSWGPPIANLEFAPGPYPYDANGALVARGRGQGNPAVAYDPTEFFRPGWTTNHHLQLGKGYKKVRFKLGLVGEQQQGPVLGQKSDNLGANLKLDNGWQKWRWSLAAHASQGNQHLAQGVNLANLLAGVLTTPPTFDNRNAGQWAHAPQASNNPYWLAQRLPDRNQQSLWGASGQLARQVGKVTLKYFINTENFDKINRWGLPTGAAGASRGRLSERQEQSTRWQQALTANWSKYLLNSDTRIEINSSYQWAHQATSLARRDGFGFRADRPLDLAVADSVVALAQGLRRTQHEPNVQAKIRLGNLVNLEVGNRAYLSSTLARPRLWLPNVGASLDLMSLIRTYYTVLSDLKLRANYAKNLSEAPLIYGKWAFQSTGLPVARYLEYFENQELLFGPNLRPEAFHKFNAGVEVGLSDNQVNLEADYFLHATQGALVPVGLAGQFGLQNAADLRTQGLEMSLNVNPHGLNGDIFSYVGGLQFSLLRPTVRRVHGSADRVPLAGFAEASMNLVAGQPYGILYGTAYLRDAEGQKVIGPDGYPLVAPDLQPLGNPNPRWTLGWHNELRWRAWTLAFVLDGRRGGQRWNGTQQVLDYLGRSARTAEERNTRDYRFAGVRENGQPNDLTVNFADPAQGLASNRWARYGPAGVGEDAIQDASWVRLREVKLTVQCSEQFLNRLATNWLRHASLSVFAKNLLLSSGYAGVDPASPLFGYGPAEGLDLFNWPQVQSYGLVLRLEL
jgi:hypothetical protein